MLKTVGHITHKHVMLSNVMRIYTTLIQGCYWNHVATSYQVGCIGKSRNIPGLKQRNIHEQGNP